MIGTRYDGYRHTENMLPFIMNVNLERTPNRLSREQNWHEELEIQLCEEGCGSVLLDGEKLSFVPGDIVTINPNVIHYTGTEKRLVYSCLIINCDFLRRSGIDCNGISFNKRAENSALNKYFDELKAEYCKSPSESPLRTAKLHILLLSLVTELAEHHSTPKDIEAAQSKAFDNVRRTIKYIRENCDKSIRLNALSLYVCADKYTLCRDFKRLTGQTIIEYTNKYRCQRAADLISQGATVAEAAAKCGFENLSFFTRCFKKYTGKLPSSYKSR